MAMLSLTPTQLALLETLDGRRLTHYKDAAIAIGKDNGPVMRSLRSLEDKGLAVANAAGDSFKRTSAGSSEIKVRLHN